MIWRESYNNAGRGNVSPYNSANSVDFRASSELGIASLKLEESSQHGFYFRVTLKENTGAVTKNKNYTILDQPKTGMRYRFY